MAKGRKKSAEEPAARSQPSPFAPALFLTSCAASAVEQRAHVRRFPPLVASSLDAAAGRRAGSRRNSDHAAVQSSLSPIRGADSWPPRCWCPLPPPPAPPVRHRCSTSASRRRNGDSGPTAAGGADERRRRTAPTASPSPTCADCRSGKMHSDPAHHDTTHSVSIDKRKIEFVRSGNGAQCACLSVSHRPTSTDHLLQRKLQCAARLLIRDARGGGRRLQRLDRGGSKRAVGSPLRRA